MFGSSVIDDLALFWEEGVSTATVLKFMPSSARMSEKCFKEKLFINGKSCSFFAMSSRLGVKHVTQCESTVTCNPALKL